jgi:hypothetical protein
MKEKMYESYDANASKRGIPAGNRPKFSLNMGKVTD